MNLGQMQLEQSQLALTDADAAGLHLIAVSVLPRRTAGPVRPSDCAFDTGDCAAAEHSDPDARIIRYAPSSVSPKWISRPHRTAVREHRWSAHSVSSAHVRARQYGAVRLAALGGQAKALVPLPLGGYGLRRQRGLPQQDVPVPIQTQFRSVFGLPVPPGG